MLACVNVVEGTCYRLMVRRNEKCIGLIILCTRGSGLAVSVLVAKMEVNVKNDPVNFELQGS